MQRFLFLFLFLFLSRAALSQTVDSIQAGGIPPKSDFRLSLISSLSFASTLTTTPHLRAYFKANDIKPVSPLGAFAHLNAGLRYKRFKLMTQAGRGIDLYVPEPRYNEQRIARQDNAEYRGTMLGYDVLNGRNRRLYLNVGTGTVSCQYSVFRRAQQYVTFPDLGQYSQPGNIPSLTLTNRYLDFNLELVQREKGRHSAAYTMRAGYRRGLRPRAWQSEAFVLEAAPTDRISQFYLQAGYNFSVNFPSRPAL